MRQQEFRLRFFDGVCNGLGVLVASCAAVLLAATLAPAQTWEASGGTPWWFDPENWSEADAMLIPPMGDVDNDPMTNDDLAVSTTSVNFVANTVDNMWNQGDGVVYDPTNDPNFANAGNLRFVDPWGPQKAWRLYVGNAGAVNSEEEAVTDLVQLTIRGDLSSDSDPAEGEPRWWIGRSSGFGNVGANALVVQESGVVTHNFGDLDLGSINTGVTGTFGNGTWDYRGGTLEQGFDTTFLAPVRRLRLSAGGSTGTGGVGTFILRNPGSGSGGYVRVANLLVAAFGGQPLGPRPNGITNGLGIVEFHALSEGTRPMQLDNLQVANGEDTDYDGVTNFDFRSSQLKIVLDEAPTTDGSGVPIDMGLFDLDWDGNGDGTFTSTGNSYDTTFSDFFADDPLSMDAVFDNGDIVEAQFGSTLYRWNIYYDGEIRWSDPNNSILDATFGGGDGIDRVDGAGGIDIVLIGLDSMSMGLPGDYNGDGFVNAADYTVWRNNLGAGDESSLNGNGDGMNGVDAGDYALWKMHFGEPNAGAGGLAASAVPEPSAVVLTLFSLVGLVGFRRRSA